VVCRIVLGRKFLCCDRRCHVQGGHSSVAIAWHIHSAETIVGLEVSTSVTETWRRVGRVRSDVSEERVASIFRVKKVCERTKASAVG
jgi:hypothetical protein